jgi:hypothetical protein
MADTSHEGRCSFMLPAFVMERDSVFCEEWVQVAETLENKNMATDRDNILCEVRTEAERFSWRPNMSLDTLKCK